MNINWQKFGIDITRLSGGKMLCPKCSHTRKNKTEKCLSVNVQEGVFNCHHCGFQGSAKEFTPQKVYAKPVPRLEKLSLKTIEYFETTRKISNNTLLRFQITEAREWMPQHGKDESNKEVNCICFNYYRGEELVNIKFRGPQKSFKMSKDSELIFYNMNAIADEKECVIVEGEIDCLTLHECGIYNVVSVPNGASKGNQKLEYLDNCWQVFENKTKIILAVDSDEAGTSLQEELARRLGKEKCFTVEYPEGCKDVNEVLLKYDNNEVARVIKEAKEIPLEGIMEMDDMFDEIKEWYEHGYPKGAKARIENFDRLLSFAPGQLTIITGIPGHGKDEFANLLMTSLAKYENWSWGICAFEESPAETVTKLIEKLIGKAFDFRIDKSKRVNETEFESGIGMVDKFFHFINTEDIDPSLTGILTKAEQMVKRFGIRGFCLNPWNWVEHSREAWMSETEYVSLALTKIIIFAKRFHVHFFLMAHPTKMGKKDGKKYDVPTLYSINGSANFFNKTYNGITIYRDDNTVDVYVQKVKQSWLGEKGLCQFTYDTYTRQYTAIADFTTKKEMKFPHNKSVSEADNEQYYKQNGSEQQDFF